MSIIAVGLDVNIDEESVREHLSKYIPVEELNTYKIEKVQKAGFLYGAKCKLGVWDRMKATQQTMFAWYKKNEGKEVTAYFPRMYRTPKIILVEGTLDGKVFSIILSNMTSGSQTFLHKKSANSGAYGPPIEIERLAISGMPYVYYSETK